MIVGTSPITAALAIAWSPNAARLFIVVIVLYYVLYEVLHTLYHLPETVRVAHGRVVRTLRLQHEIHHDPTLMRRANFNVTIPLADWVLGTTRRAIPDGGLRR
jgi:hypothetical protein